MKYIALTLVLLFGSGAFATVSVQCFVDAPCGWLEPIPGVTKDSLGFCVKAVSGDENGIEIVRVDKDDNLLPSVRLNVRVLNTNELHAASPDGAVTLDAGKYEKFLAGGLLFKTSDAPAGLGLYASCELR